MHGPVDGLWNEYQRGRSPGLKQRLVVQYLNLVRFVAGRYAVHVKGNAQGLEQGDIMQFGILGLLEAIDRFNPAQGVKFETYAAPRIRGAILDELRQLDWVPRSVRSASRRAERVVRQSSQQLGRDVVDVEIAQKLGMAVEEYHRLIRDGNAAIVSGRDTQAHGNEGSLFDGLAGEDPDPHQRLSDEEAKAFLVKAIEALPERERTVVSLYYYEGLKFGEIGKVFQVSESRISQIHAEVLRNLRKTLGYLQ